MLQMFRQRTREYTSDRFCRRRSCCAAGEVSRGGMEGRHVYVREARGFSEAQSWVNMGADLHHALRFFFRERIKKSGIGVIYV